MELDHLIEQHSTSRLNQMKAIFANIFILQNKLQTIFDKGNTNITLKQFMLLTMIKQSGQKLTFTKLGQLLGCSRQNIKKLAALLEQKGFITITQNPNDTRAATITPTSIMKDYFIEIEDYHKQILTLLFEDYTDEEIKRFFQTLTKLHGGIEKTEHYILGEINHEKNSCSL